LAIFQSESPGAMRRVLNDDIADGATGETDGLPSAGTGDEETEPETLGASAGRIVGIGANGFAGEKPIGAAG
jgi:hypothetical protein